MKLFLSAIVLLTGCLTSKTQTSVSSQSAGTSGTLSLDLTSTLGSNLQARLLTGGLTQSQAAIIASSAESSSGNESGFTLNAMHQVLVQPKIRHALTVSSILPAMAGGAFQAIGSLGLVDDASRLLVMGVVAGALGDLSFDQTVPAIAALSESQHVSALAAINYTATASVTMTGLTSASYASGVMSMSAAVANSAVAQAPGSAATYLPAIASGGAYAAVALPVSSSIAASILGGQSLMVTAALANVPSISLASIAAVTSSITSNCLQTVFSMVPSGNAPYFVQAVGTGVSGSLGYFGSLSQNQQASIASSVASNAMGMMMVSAPSAQHSALTQSLAAGLVSGTSSVVTDSASAALFSGTITNSLIGANASMSGQVAAGAVMGLGNISSVSGSLVNLSCSVTAAAVAANPSNAQNIAQSAANAMDASSMSGYGAQLQSAAGLNAPVIASNTSTVINYSTGVSVPQYLQPPLVTYSVSNSLVGAPFYLMPSISASFSVTSKVFSVPGGLPAGLSITASSGAISGVATQASSPSVYSVSVLFKQGNQVVAVTTTVRLGFLQASWLGLATSSSIAGSLCTLLSTFSLSSGWCTGGYAIATTAGGSVSSFSPKDITILGEYLYAVTPYGVTRFLNGNYAGSVGVTGAGVTTGWTESSLIQSAYSISGAYKNLVSITNDGAAYLYAIDQGSNTIVRINASTGIYAGSYGALYPSGVTTGWSMVSLVYTTTTSAATGGLNKPTAIRYLNGLLYVVDGGLAAVQVYSVTINSSITHTGWIGAGSVSQSSGVSYCSGFCSTNSNYAYQSFGVTLTGSQFSFYPGEKRTGVLPQVVLYKPIGIALNNSYIYITDGLCNIIQKFSIANGYSYEGYIGTNNVNTAGWSTASLTSCAASTVVGRFYGPSALAVDMNDTTLYIADTGNSRIVRAATNGAVNGWQGKCATSGANCYADSFGTKTWLTSGSAAPGQLDVNFNTPAGMILGFDPTLSNSQVLLIADPANNRIVRLSP